MQPTIDTRYEKAVQYIQSNKEILTAVHETLPERFQSDTSIIFMVADSLIRPLLSTNLVIALKYGIMRSDTLVYDSLQNIERKKLYQYGQFYSQPMKLPELGSLSMHGNPHAVIFFSRPYENLLRVLILPAKIEFTGKFIHSQEQIEKEQATAEEIPVINTDFSRMSSFNRGINISLLFDENDSIKAATFSLIVFD